MNEDISINCVCACVRALIFLQSAGLLSGPQVAKTRDHLVLMNVYVMRALFY